MLGIFKKLIQKDTVPLVHVEGKDKITKLQWVGDVQNNPNSLLDLFSLIEWEKASDTVEFFFKGKRLGRGYVGDVAGPTVNIKRVVKAPAEGKEVSGPEKMPVPDLWSVEALAKRISESVPGFDKKAEPDVPVVVLKGSSAVVEVHFEYAKVLDGAVCITRTSDRYRINTDTKLEIAMPDGTVNAGWICDETGQTVTISRDVKVKGLLRNKKGEPILKPDNTPVEVEVGINWTGRLGKGATNDRVTALWSSAVSGKEKLIFGALMFIGGNLIGVVTNI